MANGAGVDTLTVKKADEWRPVFLANLAETCNVSSACLAAGISRQTAYTHRQQYDGFKAQWDEALGIGVWTLEEEAIRRAVKGVDEPVFYQGRSVGAVRKYSDTLLIFLLKAHDPEKYRERIDMTSKGEKLPQPQYHVYIPDNGRQGPQETVTNE